MHAALGGLIAKSTGAVHARRDASSKKIGGRRRHRFSIAAGIRVEQRRPGRGQTVDVEGSACMDLHGGSQGAAARSTGRPVVGGRHQVDFRVYSWHGGE
jgi:hypothetical protein